MVCFREQCGVRLERYALEVVLNDGATVVRDMTRLRLIQVWFATMSLVVVASVALGATVTVGTAAVLLALSLVPPAIVLVLWPGVQPITADVLYGRDRRG